MTLLRSFVTDIASGIYRDRKLQTIECERAPKMFHTVSPNRRITCVWQFMGFRIWPKPYYADPSPNPHGFAVENVPKGTGKKLRKLRAVLRVLGLEFRASGSFQEEEGRVLIPKTQSWRGSFRGASHQPKQNYASVPKPPK